MKLVFKIFIFLILCIIFFYKIDNTALQSYDEAWYADITRSLVSSHNPFQLKFNYSLFTDHPPFGYILMAIPTFFLGSNEFSTRFMSAILGIGSIILIYFSGKLLKNRYVGISAGAILISSMWFMIRARSGNLDVPFVFLSLLTFFNLLKSKSNLKYLYLAALSTALLFLTKTLVGVGIVPVFVYTLWLRKKDLNSLILTKLAVIFLIIILPWYIYNQLLDNNFLFHHFIEIGTRNKESLFSFDDFNKTILYLKIGIGKWYKILIASLIATIYLWIKSKNDRVSLNLIILYLMGFSLPFLFSNKVEIWHLIPAYVPIALLIAYVLETTVALLFSNKKILSYLVLVLVLIISIYQFKQFSNLIYFNTYQYSAEKDIALKSSKYSDIYLMDTFYPALVYYSGSKIIPLYWEENAYQKMKDILKQKNGSILLIGNKFYTDLKNDEIEFETLDANDSYYLIKS